MILKRPYYVKEVEVKEGETFVDLRDYQDDKTVLKNPHKGWYWHYIDNGYGSEWYREGYEEVVIDENGKKIVNILDDVADFPGLNHLYLRFDWGDIEYEEDSLDWTYLDAIMEAWGKKGYTFSLRLCTYEGAEDGVKKYATPKWVFDAGAKYTLVKGARLEPDYGDPIFIEKLEKFMKKFAQKYDGDERVEFVDVGTYGTWGEGHTCEGSEKVFSFETMIKHIDLHADYFKNTFILLNDDYVCHREEQNAGENDRIIAYALERGLGLRDDSVCVDGYCEWFGYNSMRSPSLYDAFYKNAPTDIELAHFWHYTDPIHNPLLIRSGYTALDAFKRGRVTFAGFHGYPRPFLETYPDFAQYCANRLGYWYFIEGLILPQTIKQDKNEISIFFTNRGFADTKYKFDFQLRLKSNEHEFVFHTNIDNRKWQPCSVDSYENWEKETVELDASCIPSGEYELELCVFEKNRRILIAMDDNRMQDGWYHLTKISI